jgi:hypothetical protein
MNLLYGLCGCPAVYVVICSRTAVCGSVAVYGSVRQCDSVRWCERQVVLGIVLSGLYVVRTGSTDWTEAPTNSCFWELK